jgi:hypothetical protein
MTRLATGKISGKSVRFDLPYLGKVEQIRVFCGVARQREQGITGKLQGIGLDRNRPNWNEYVGPSIWSINTPPSTIPPRAKQIADLRQHITDREPLIVVLH